MGAAYVFLNGSGRKRAVRGGFGLFHDLGAGNAGQAAIDFPYARTKARPAIPYPFDTASVAAPDVTSLAPPYNGQTFVAFPDHKTPETYEWNLTLEQSIGRSQAVTVSYVGAAGKHLVRRETYSLPNAGPDFTGTTGVDISRSNASSDYAALQVQYRRRLSGGLQALASYTLSKSEDTISNAVVSQPRSDRLDPELFRGPSDFDRRHVFSAAVTYLVPAPASGLMAPLLRDWSLAATLQMQSAAPVSITFNRDLGFGSIAVMPDFVPGVPLYLDDPTAPGDRRLNPVAFSIPAELRVGNLPRNGLRAYPFRQVDLSLTRSVPLFSSVKLQIRADAFNLFNTPNVGNPSGFLGSVTTAGVFTPFAGFGRATSSLDNTLGGSNGLYRLYAAGGPRSIQLSGRFTF